MINIHRAVPHEAIAARPIMPIHWNSGIVFAILIFRLAIAVSIWILFSYTQADDYRLDTRISCPSSSEQSRCHTGIRHGRDPPFHALELFA